MKPYEWIDVDGRHLKITPGRGPVAWLTVDDHGSSRTVEVESSAVPDAALALYEAAGLPEPLILENLPAPAGLAENGGIYAGRRAGKVLVGRRHVQPEELDPDAALLLAASLARQALAIKSGEPDPDAVAALADVIEAEDYDLDYENRHALARTILLGGWTREPQA